MLNHDVDNDDFLSKIEILLQMTRSSKEIMAYWLKELKVKIIIPPSNQPTNKKQQAKTS